MYSKVTFHEGPGRYTIGSYVAGWPLVSGWIGVSSYHTFPDPADEIGWRAFIPELRSNYISMNNTGFWVSAGSWGKGGREDKYNAPELAFEKRTFSPLWDEPGIKTVFDGTDTLLDPAVITDLAGGSNDVIDNLRPVIADDGTVVIRAGVNTTSPVSVYSNTGDRTVVADVTLNGGKFGSLEESVAISASGKVVAFAGNRGDGDGIFISVKNGIDFTGPGTGRRYINIVGEGKPDLGFGSPLIDGDSESRRRFFQKFNFEEGLFLLHFENGDPDDSSGADDGLVNDSIVVAFMAQPNAPKVLYPKHMRPAQDYSMTQWACGQCALI